MVAQIRAAIPKYRQVHILIALISCDYAHIQELITKRPYDHLFGDSPGDQQHAVEVIHEVNASFERLVLWYEDFYIHTCIFLDIVARILYWSFPCSYRRLVKVSSFGLFYQSLENTSDSVLQRVAGVLVKLAGIYENTLKPLRDKVIVHHRPSVLPGASYVGIRVAVIDEFRPDRDKIIAQLRTELEKQIDLTGYPDDDIELVSRLVAEGNPVMAVHSEKLGVIGVELPPPGSIWEAIEEQCSKILELFGELAKMIAHKTE